MVNVGNQLQRDYNPKPNSSEKARKRSLHTLKWDYLFPGNYRSAVKSPLREQRSEEQHSDLD